jgi:hypothetical protein
VTCCRGTPSCEGVGEKHWCTASKPWKVAEPASHPGIKLADVIPLFRKTCPCGWLPPKNLTVDVAGTTFGSTARVTLECPSCGRRIEMHPLPKEENPVRHARVKHIADEAASRAKQQGFHKPARFEYGRWSISLSYGNRQEVLTLMREVGRDASAEVHSTWHLSARPRCRVDSADCAELNELVAALGFQQTDMVDALSTPTGIHWHRIEA